jgi:hypothetical protein
VPHHFVEFNWKVRTVELLQGDFAKLRELLDPSSCREVTVQVRRKVRSSGGQELSIGITRSVFLLVDRHIGSL